MYSIKPSELTITEVKAKSIRVEKRKKKLKYIYIYIYIYIYGLNINSFSSLIKRDSFGLYVYLFVCWFAFFPEIVLVMINWSQDFESSNVVCNHTRD